MAYSDGHASRLDRIVGFALWLVTGFILIEPMLALLVEGCFWEGGCSSSQAPRFIGALIAALLLGAPVGWSAYAVLNRVFYRSGP